MTHWIVVADAGRARIFASDEELETWHNVHELEHERGRQPAAELVSDARGATRAGPGLERSAFDRHTDPHVTERVRFAREVAALVEQGLDGDAWERLVLVAPPAFLGDLRAALSPRALRKVAASVHHDLTRTSTRDLPAAVRRHLPDDAGRDL